MSKGKRPLLKISIRTKLLLASLSLLAVPWLGYQYIQGLEAYLRSAQEQRLLDRVAIIASLMDDQQLLFKSRPPPAHSAAVDAHLYVRPLQSPIQLDGYSDDWITYQDREQHLGAAGDNLDFRVSYRLGVWDGYLYLLFRVTDDAVVYRHPDSLQPGSGDHLRIGLQDRHGEYKRYRLSTISPGWVSAYLMPERAKETLPAASEFRIKGEWQEMPGGYTLEIRIPADMIGDKLSFALVDIDNDTTRNAEQVLASSDTEHLTSLGTIVLPIPHMEALLKRLEQTQRRIWVVDSEGRVIGLADRLDQGIAQNSEAVAEMEELSTLSKLLRIFYRLLLDQPRSEFKDPLSSASRLDDPVVQVALLGHPQAGWRQTEDENVNLLSAAHPVYVNDQLAGAVVIEETSNSVLLLQNRAIEALLNLSLLAFVLTIGVLLVFATRLSIRVRRLRNEVEASIAVDGRVQGKINYPKAGDELGDLGRSFYEMHERLAQYNRYLESMAGKLAHELRTPISIVRSSLDNLDAAQSGDETQVYLQRANEGVERLSGILTRMSEATHLEQTIQQEQPGPYVINEVVAVCVAGYRLAHPQRQFMFHDLNKKVEVLGSPELLAQMLDKLIGNALDFARQGAAIVISLEQKPGTVFLCVANEGPVLPDEMRVNLFDSMVSMRQGKSDQPHLGLGLYIVRLIAEYHQGHVEVENLTDNAGVVFRVALPVS